MSLDESIERLQVSAEIDRLRKINATLLRALELLVDDVQDYPSWQRPCFALDIANAAIELARENK